MKKVPGYDWRKLIMNIVIKPFTTSEQAMHIALNQIGVHEQPEGSNWGPEIKKYLKTVGITFPASWCMAFVNWCVNETGNPNKLFNSASVLTTWQKTNKSLRVTKPQPGDIFIMNFKNGAGHTGFVTDVKEGRIYTVEGNSNKDGSREGKMVCRKPNGRLISNIYGFIRLA